MNNLLQQCTGLLALACMGLMPISGYAAADVRKARPVAQPTKPKTAPAVRQKMPIVGKKKAVNRNDDCSSSSSSSSAHPKKCDADYIIVGLGTAGTVAARFLSDPVNGKYKNSVLVLEAGQNHFDDPIVFEGTATLFPNLEELAYNTKFSYTQICPDNNPILGFFPNEQYSAGRMWFGSSGHNFQFCVRGSSDRWDELAGVVGSPQWTYFNLLPLFESFETYFGASSEPQFRGNNGPLLISQFGPPPVSGDFFPDIVSAVTGAPILPDFNVPEGNTATTSGQFFSSPDGQFRSFAYYFLPTTLLSRDGKGQNGRKLEVRSGAFVNRVIFKGKKAIGVEYISEDGKYHTVYAKKKILLCAGCPFSATILQRSGIGPQAVLQDPFVNIPILVDNPIVGTNLKTHFGVLAGTTGLPLGIQNVSNCFSDGRNFFAPAGTGDNLRRYSMQFIPTFGIAPAGILSAANINPATPSTAMVSLNLRPRSSGTAFIVSNSPFEQPDIRFNLYSDGDLSDPASDLSASVAGFKIIKAIADAAGLTMLYPDPSHFASDAELAFDAGAQINYSGLTMNNHYAGTCQMGTDISNGVISGEDLHVFGVKNLMVADSSIYPFPATGNTSMQCYIAGAKAAEIILAGQ